MTEADVLYSDVKFTRTSGLMNDGGRRPECPERTHTDTGRTCKPHTEMHPVDPSIRTSDGRSKVTSERVLLLVLCCLLAAAASGLGVLSFINIQNNKRLQTLKEEFEAMRNNFTNEQYPKCEVGWDLHEGKCYHFSASKFTWIQSRAECRCRGGDLVKIDSRAEQSFLESRVREKMKDDKDKFWIGLTDSSEEGRWLWVDGSPLDKSLTFWHGTEPDNWTIENPDGEDCVRMGKKGEAEDLKCWFDRSCNVLHRNICEKPAVTGRVTRV